MWISEEHCLERNSLVTVTVGGNGVGTFEEC